MIRPTQPGPPLLTMQWLVLSGEELAFEGSIYLSTICEELGFVLFLPKGFVEI
jgi:hypothetical protein